MASEIDVTSNSEVFIVREGRAEILMKRDLEGDLAIEFYRDTPYEWKGMYIPKGALPALKEWIKNLPDPT